MISRDGKWVFRPGLQKSSGIISATIEKVDKPPLPKYAMSKELRRKGLALGLEQFCNGKGADH